MDYKALLDEEYRQQSRCMEEAKTVVLYGNSVAACIMGTALRELGFTAPCPVFDSGRFLDGEAAPPRDAGAVVLCSSRKATREDMARDAAVYFPDAAVFDYFAIYYRWVTAAAGRPCDRDLLAQTLWLCRQDRCLPNIDSINTFYCNLRCRECHNGIPQRREKRRIPADSQVFHLKKITDKLPITQCNFQGGEVFTDADFALFVEKHARNPRVALFTVATNGAVLPGDAVFRAIRAAGAMIRISDYGPLSAEKQAIEEKCRAFGIPCFSFPMAETWRAFGPYRSRGRSEAELRRICRECCFGTHDMMFVDDKLFCCLRTLYADAVGDRSPAAAANTLDLDSDFTLQELQDLAEGKSLWRMCDYCDAPMRVIPPAEQLP